VADLFGGLPEKEKPPAPADERRLQAETWTAGYLTRLQNAKTPEESHIIAEKATNFITRLRETQLDLFYRAYQATGERYHRLLCEKWGRPFNRADAYPIGHFHHPEDPERPKP
jgi:hypothetical protein